MDDNSEQPDYGNVLKIFELPQSNDGNFTYEFNEILEKEIDRMLATAPERMMQILYKLDVYESKVQTVFQFMTREEWPAALANLIIEREKLRLELRRKYSSGS